MSLGGTQGTPSVAKDRLDQVLSHGSALLTTTHEVLLGSVSPLLGNPWEAIHEVHLGSVGPLLGNPWVSQGSQAILEVLLGSVRPSPRAPVARVADPLDHLI